MDETQNLEHDLPQEELVDFIKLNTLKDIIPEVEPDDNDDPGDPPGVVEVDTEWTPENDEEEL